MDISSQQSYDKGAPKRSEAARVVAGGSLAEGIVGAAAIVLSILGLVGIVPFLMLYIATIAVGAALLFEGGAISSRISSLIAQSPSQRSDIEQIGSGMTAEFLAGAVGLALGILALLGIAPITLVSIASIVYGGALIMGGSVTAKINSLTFESGYEGETARSVAREAVKAASGVQVLIGIGAVVLGILALLEIAPVTLVLVSMLALGFADLLSGGAVGGRMLSVFRRDFK
ncbi:hypothetical protein CHISP_2626 [Chitinispirillum alkaliphilum]|nr:hypothetical protein CHISP_2626 [Chitinispirillum alkaliphilum]